MAHPMDELIWALCGVTFKNNVIWELRSSKWGCPNCGSREEWIAKIGEGVCVLLARNMAYRTKGIFSKQRTEFVTYTFSLLVTLHGYSESADQDRDSREAVELSDRDRNAGHGRKLYFWMNHLHEEILHQQRHFAIEAQDKKERELMNHTLPPPAFEPCDDSDEMFRKGKELINTLTVTIGGCVA